MRKSFLTVVVLSAFFHGVLADVNDTQKINRRALVQRHNVFVSEFNSLWPLSVGNGKFVFTVDPTGLQTFPDKYDEGIPLSTMSQWGWHTFDNTGNYKLEDTFVEVDTHGRKVPYNIIQDSPAAAYLRANPHRVNLAQIGFVFLNADGSQASADELKNTNQTLDLWQGVLKSKFQFDNQPVEVETLCHPEKDLIAVRVKSQLLESKRLIVSLRFPHAAGVWGPKSSVWNKPDSHTIRLIKNNSSSAHWLRQMDDLEYNCVLKYPPKTRLKKVAGQSYRIIPPADTNSFGFCLSLSKEPVDVSGYEFQTVRSQCQAYWKYFWTTGAAVDLSQSADPRRKELERRIVLSQYLTAIQSAQKYPPAETGLTCNSWFGKFHLEMHWWHGVHFALWDRLDMFEKSLDWYAQIMPVAKQIAKRQGYEGARWPKMVGPDGHDAPSTIGPLLIWQQPHPVYYAELIYRQKPTKQTLEKYEEIVQQSAEFMASYVHYDEQKECFELGPPLLSAREFNVESYAETKNPAFELAYWAWALDKANQWRTRLGRKPEPKWNHIIKNLAPLPIHNGIYVEQQTPLVCDGGHPTMLAAFGLLPQTHLLDKETMRKTLKHVMQNWNHDETWGWDYPMLAMTAARLNEPDIAVDALLKDAQKNTYLPNGHNYQGPNLPVYLPGNGGLLTAVAMMAAGWDDCPDRPAPGFPDNGRWTVRAEGFKKMP